MHTFFSTVQCVLIKVCIIPSRDKEYLHYYPQKFTSAFFLPAHSHKYSALYVSITTDYVCLFQNFLQMNQVAHGSYFFSISCLKFMHVVYINKFLLFVAEQYSFCGYTKICSSTFPLIDIWVVSSLVLLGIKLLWTFLYKSYQTYIFICLGETCRGRIVGSQQRHIFNFLGS